MAAAEPVWSSSPVQLVAFDGKGPHGPRLALQDTAKKQLLKTVGNCPVQVVCVCGLYRTGKSLLLNILAGTQGESFKVGSSTRACTAGMWALPSEPTGAGQKVCLLIDCEGSGSTEKDRDHDARLFALAVLISSTLLFNSRGVITETAVQSLALAASLAEHIFRQNRESAPQMTVSPQFTWVLRDFALALEDPAGREITAKEYLEQALRSNLGSNVSDAREKILSLFPQRDCVTLPRPVNDEEQLENLAAIPLTDMRPKFQAEVQVLRTRVRQSPVLKTPAGGPATVGALLALIESYLKAINEGGVPKLGSAWSHVEFQECDRAVDEAMTFFSNKMSAVSASLPKTTADLERCVQEGKLGARERFHELCMGSDKTRNEYAQELDQNMEETVNRLVKQNDNLASQQNEDWLRSRWEVDELLREYRIKFDAGQITKEDCDRAHRLLNAHVTEISAAFRREAVGSDAVIEVALRQCEQKLASAQKEIGSWRQMQSESVDDRPQDDQERKRPEKKKEQRKERSNQKEVNFGQDEETEESRAGKQPKCCTLQ